MPETNNGLWIILRDVHGEIDRQHAENGEDAIRIAIVMLAHVPAFKDGDSMRVAKEPDQVPRLVELP